MYKIILYNCGSRIKLIQKFEKYGDAVRKYNQILKENQVFFPKKTMWNGIEADYELAITSPPGTKKIDYIRNNIGALVKIKTKNNFIIKKISPYYIEETFLHKNNEELYDFKSFIKKFIFNSKTNIIYSLNNKLVIEYFENDEIDLFILKSNQDSIRLNELIKEFTYANSLSNFIFFNEPTKDNKIRLYNKLTEKLKVTREYLFRLKTR